MVFPRTAESSVAAANSTSGSSGTEREASGRVGGAQARNRGTEFGTCIARQSVYLDASHLLGSRVMSLRPRSLKYEYELYIESELEAYKDSVPRSVLLRIGDEAVSILAAQQQLALTELLLSEEVDRIIRKRLRLPVYRTWCRRRLNALAEFRRPERWGMTADAAVVRTVPVATSGHVLVAGFEEASSALFLAANGCAVTAIDPVEDVVERVLSAAVEVGLTTHLRGFVADLATWSPDLPLNALVCGANAFTTLPTEQRGRVLSPANGDDGRRSPRRPEHCRR